MHKTLLLIIFIIFTYQVNAQSHNCGVSSADGFIIKQRMLENRAHFSKVSSKNLQNKKAITYIPVSFHAVSNSSGVGAASDKRIIDELCGINSLYFDQDIQFFIYNKINYITSNDLDDDATSNASASFMASNKINGTLNIFIGRALNNPASSFYSPSSDYIFLLDLMMSPQGKTLGHEIGHFFTLPHTFYGWEGTGAETTYGGQSVPSSIGGWGGWGGFSPEAEPRTGGQANCNSAADGFCDTEADYVSSRTNCPYILTVLDPFGNAINPDETNIMSYASDACVNTFSNEQKTAMFNDISSRTWVSNTPPNTADLTGSSVITPISPINNAQLGSILNPNVLLQWNPVVGASWYLLRVAGPGVNIEEIVWSSSNSYNLSTTGMTNGSTYLWKIAPMNNVSTCEPFSPLYRFKATTGITSVTSEALEDIFIYPNPVTNQLVIKGNNSHEFLTYSLFNNLGQLISEKKINNNFESVDFSDLSKGFYNLVITQENNTPIFKKIIKH